jgi:hypothetical protein
VMDFFEAAAAGFLRFCADTSVWPPGQTKTKSAAIVSSKKKRPEKI